MTEAAPLIIEAALNGARDRREHPAIPYTPAEVAAEAVRCAAAGAQVVHLHSRGPNGEPTLDATWYAEAHRRLRDAAPDLLISITSVRRAGLPVEPILGLLATLARDPATCPDLISINLGHITVWEPAGWPGEALLRRTRHVPNSYHDVVALLAACREHGIVPELGLMDLGFLSNAVALRNDHRLPATPWFLIELDSPGWGAGPQVARAEPAVYDFLAAQVRRHFPASGWAAHGAGRTGYAVIERAIAGGAHARVGFEDAVELPDGTAPTSNAELVRWAVAVAAQAGRPLATPGETRRRLGWLGPHPSPLPKGEGA